MAKPSRYLTEDHPEIAAQWSAANERHVATLTVSSNVRGEWVCERGHTWQAKVCNRTGFLTGCPVCSNKIVLPGFNDLATTDPNLAEEWDASNERLVTEVTNGMGHKVAWRCRDCDNVWSTTIASRARSGTGCPFCSGQRVTPGVSDLATLRPDLAAEWDASNAVSAHEVSPGSGRKAHWVCTHGHRWEAIIGNRSKGSGCPVCAGQRVETGFNDLTTTHPMLLTEWDMERNDVDPATLTYGSQRRVHWRCERGHRWETELCQRAIAGSGCPRCAAAGTSVGEIQIADYIESLGVAVQRNARRPVRGFELDAYMPELNLAIEFNGLYWHSELHKPRTYHRDKYLACKAQGIRLVQIWEDDWEMREPIVRRMLAYLVGKDERGAVYARTTAVVQATAAQAQQFMRDNHIQGYIPGSLYIALEARGKLVAMSVWRRQGPDLMLARYATSQRVVGGLGKLLAHVVREHKPSSVITFSDNTLSDGKLYQTLGMLREAELPVDYMYIVGKQRVHKFNYRKAAFRRRDDLHFEDGLTERQLAALNKIARIYDAGKVRWRLPCDAQGPGPGR